MIILINAIPIWFYTDLLEYYWVYFLCCILQYHDYCVTTNLYFLIPSPFYPSTLTTIKMFSVSMSLFPFCLFMFLIQLLIDMYLLPFHCSYFLSSSSRRIFNISCNTGLVVMNSFSIFLSGMLLICPFDSKW